MIYNLIITFLLIACFFACVYCYILGVKHGSKVREGQTPVLKNPIQYVTEKAEQKKEEGKRAEAEDELIAAMNATPETMLLYLKEEKNKGK